MAAGEHHNGANAAQGRQQPQRHPKYPAGVAGIILGQAVGHHAGNGHRQSGGGDGQKQIVGRKYRLENAQPFRADQPGEGNAEQDPYQLADNARCAQHGDAAYQGLGRLCHKDLPLHRQDGECRFLLYAGLSFGTRENPLRRASGQKKPLLLRAGRRAARYCSI